MATGRDRVAQTLLEHHGAFRNVRIWRFTTNNHEHVELYVGTNATRERDHPHNPKELIDPSGRRLILVMTDCVSPAWHSGKVQSMLDIWGHKNLVSLIQVFPRRLWQQTALTNADLIQIDTHLPYISNSQFKSHSPVQWVDEGLSVEDRLAYPVVTLEYRSLHNWAWMITGTERTWVPGVVFSSDEADDVDPDQGHITVYSSFCSETRPVIPSKCITDCTQAYGAVSSAPYRLICK